MSAKRLEPNKKLKYSKMGTKEPIDKKLGKVKTLVSRAMYYQIVFVKIIRLWKHIPEQ